MLIDAKGLSYIYPINHVVFKDINFQVEEGDFWGILGKNGAGKTTLIDVLLGLKTPTTGSVTILKEEPYGIKSNHQADVVYLSQDVYLKGDITVDEFFKFHSFFFKNYSKDIEEDLVNYFDLDRNILIGALSTGQQRKVQIVSGLAADTKLILIDEITAVLDPETRFKFFKKIVEFNKKHNKTIMLATNIAEDLKTRTNKILLINNKSQGEILNPNDLDSIFITSE